MIVSKPRPSYENKWSMASSLRVMKYPKTPHLPFSPGKLLCVSICISLVAYVLKPVTDNLLTQAWSCVQLLQSTRQQKNC